MRLDVALMLHAYQPWWQFPDVLERIASETYSPNWTKIVLDERYRLSLNVNYSLVELFRNKGMGFMNGLIQQMIDTGRVDFTGTSAYHAFLPLVSGRQREFQVQLQEENMAECFSGLETRGFFLPEMGYSPELAAFIRKKGYEWTVTDDPPFIAHHNVQPPYDKIYSAGGLGVFLRSKIWSFDKVANQYTSGKELAEEMAAGFKNWTGGKDAYVVIAMDFETFDHHKKGYWDHCLARLVDTAESPVKGVDIRISSLSDVFDLYNGKMEEIYIPKGSWSTSADDYRSGNFFPLWDDTGNFRRPHELMWRLYEIAENSLNGRTDAHLALARGVNSCSWWSLPLGKPHLSRYGVNEILRSAEISKSPDIYEAYKIREELRQMGI